MRTRSFFIGALVLTSAAALNRILGFVFQAVVYRLIGAEGVGLFNLVYPIYILILVITTAGIPLAVSKMVAQYLAQNNMRSISKIFRVAILLVLFSSIFFTILTIVLFPLFTKYIFYDSRVSLCFAAMIPGILIVSASSVFRGYFQGLHDMAPTAVAQVIEQIIRIISGLILAYYLLPTGVAVAAAGIAAGGVIGEFFGLGALVLVYKKSTRTQLKNPPGTNIRTKHVLKDFFKLCGPITIGRIISTLLVSVDAFLIPRRLEAAGLASIEATKLYGQFTAVALTLISIPTLITISLATALVPAISDAEAKNNQYLLRTRSGDAIRITILAAIPFTLYFLLYSYEFTEYIFKASDVAGLLKILCFSGPFFYIIQTTTGILQGLGQPLIPVKNMIYGSLVKIAGIWFLTATPTLNIDGTALSFTLFYIIVSLLNVNSLYRFTRVNFKLIPFLSKSSLALIGLTLVLLLLTTTFKTYGIWGPASWATTLIISSLVYVILLFLSGLITKQDLSRFSFLKKFIRL